MAKYHVRPEVPQRVDGGKAPWDDGVVNEDTEYVFRISFYLSSAVWKTRYNLHTTISIFSFNLARKWHKDKAT